MCHLKWYQQENLSYDDQQKLLREGSFRKIHELDPKNSDLEVRVGDRIAILLSNGLVGYYTITAVEDVDRQYIYGRDESGISEKGREFALDSGMFPIHDIGFKVVQNFPWETKSRG